jgi:hypothetical protein
MIENLPLEILICYCATKIIQEKYLDEQALIQIYYHLHHMYGDTQEKETIH